jgi:hypothetical protein
MQLPKNNTLFRSNGVCNLPRPWLTSLKSGETTFADFSPSLARALDQSSLRLAIALAENAKSWVLSRAPWNLASYFI